MYTHAEKKILIFQLRKGVTAMFRGLDSGLYTSLIFISLLPVNFDILETNASSVSELSTASLSAQMFV